MTDLNGQIAELLLKCKESFLEHRLMVATAESLTGGLISAYLTSLPGSSEFFDRAFITYNNRAKHEMLEVSALTLENMSELSLGCVAEMAAGTIRRSHAHLSVAVSGVAGPSGGNDANPVGTVYVGFGVRGEGLYVNRCHTVYVGFGVRGEGLYVNRCHFAGDRDGVRLNTVCEALKGLYTLSEGRIPAGYRVAHSFIPEAPNLHI